MMNFGLIAVMFAVFYFLLIRPQQKKQKEHAKMLSELKKGDQVVTGGGLIGTISGSTDKTFVVEVSEKVRVRVLRSQVLDKYTEAETKKTDK
jgi:preprotein translocase subunit YajC